MDGYQFDRIARRLAVAPTRRTALRLLAGAVLGGVLTSFGIEAAAAVIKAARPVVGMGSAVPVAAIGTGVCTASARR